MAIESDIEALWRARLAARRLGRETARRRRPVQEPPKDIGRELQRIARLGNNGSG